MALPTSGRGVDSSEISDSGKAIAIASRLCLNSFRTAVLDAAVTTTARTHW